MVANKIVNWMGVKVACCEKHAKKIRDFGLELGLLLKSEPNKNYIHNPYCEFCKNIEKRNEK